MNKKTTNFFLIDADSTTDKETGRVIIRLAGMLREGKLVIVNDANFLPYFYVLPMDEGRIEELSKTLLDKALPDGARFEKTEIVKRLFSGKKVKAIQAFLKHPSQVRMAREQVRGIDGVSEVLEADILFVRRYLIDHDLEMLGECTVKTETEAEGSKLNAIDAPKPLRENTESAFEPKVLAFDIETHNPKGMPRPDKDPIIMISLATTGGLSKVLSWGGLPKDGAPPDFVEILKDEKAMIERFAELVREDDPNIITGYNSDQFDFPYLLQRSEKLRARMRIGVDGDGISLTHNRPFQVPKCFGRAIVDVYPLVRNLISRTLEAETLDLDTVARELIGEGKVEGVGYEEIMKLWDKRELARLYEYSLQDSELVLKLATQLLPNVYELASLTRTTLADASRMTSGQLVEWFLIRHAHNQGILVPNQPRDHDVASRMRSTYTGGFVVSPKRGLHENIVVVDFRSLYPSIIIGHNIDPATLNCNCCKGGGNVSPSGVWSCEKKKGFIPDVLHEILDKRQEYKSRLKKMKDKEGIEYRLLDARQNGLKIIANSTYGYMGFAGARWYSLECATAITAWGRKYIQDTIRKAEDEGFEVLYGDTDSVFFSPAKDIPLSEDAIREFIRRVNRTLPESMELELQGIYRRGVLIAKKRYAMLGNDGRIIVKGLERIRRDWAPVAKNAQEEVLRAVLDKGDPNLALKVVRETIERLRKRQVSMDDVTILTQLTQDPANYKITSPHVEAAKRAIAAGKEYRAGMLVKFVITTKNKEKKKTTISASSYPVEDVSLADYDPEYYINNQVIPATMRILEALGYDESILDETTRAGGAQTALKKFF